MNLKKTILLLTLVIPGALYVFLKIFGSNTFVVPVYYEQGVDSDYCDIHLDTTYTVDARVSTLYYAHSASNVNLEQVLLLLTRVNSNAEVAIVGLENLNEAPIPHESFVTYEGMLPNMLVEFLSCKLLIYEQSPNIYDYLVLADGTGRIRGYFDSGNEKDFDRLLAELKVLKAE